MTKNAEKNVLKSFTEEWTYFDQTGFRDEEFEKTFESYFGIFPWSSLPESAEGFDLGCGSGRWARGVAPRVERIHCIDTNERVLDVARMNLAGFSNAEFHCATVDSIPLADASMDFGYCLGVLHHVPDTQAGLNAATSKLKHGAPFLLYLYYAFDNRPVWFIAIWKMSEPLRYFLSRCPFPLRLLGSQLIAALVYFPLARIALLLEKAGMSVDTLPLSAYRGKTFYTMRTDALDRFGTQLEKRFTRAEIQGMMEKAGLERIVFGEDVPYWCAVGTRTMT